MKTVVETINSSEMLLISHHVETSLKLCFSFVSRYLSIRFQRRFQFAFWNADFKLRAANQLIKV